MNQPNPTLTESKPVQYAGVFRRFLANTVDTALLSLIGYVILSNTSVGQYYTKIFKANTLQEMTALSANVNGGIASYLSLILPLLFQGIFLLHYDGATPGKKLLGIRVQRDDEKPLTYATVLVRYLGTLLSSLTIFFFSFGFLMAIWDKKKQMLHDKIAGTVVVVVKPARTIWAVLIVMFYWIAITVFFMALIAKAYTLGAAEQKKLQNNSSTTRIIINKEAEPLYIQSQAIFAEMAKEKVDRARISKLNDENIAVLREALKLDPKSATILVALVDASTWVNSSLTAEEALEYAIQAQKLEPESIRYTTSVGNAYYSLQRYDDAILEYQKALRMNESDAYTHMYLGFSYHSIKLFDEAKKHYERAIELYTAANDSNGVNDQTLLLLKKKLEMVTKH